MGSLRTVRDAAGRVGVGVDGRNHYADAESTARRLEQAGFVDVHCELVPEPIRFPDRGSLVEYLTDAALAPYERGAELASQVADELDEPVADFVRLTLTARRPGP
jgi:trans-aconitate 2-methyltransferase